MKSTLGIAALAAAISFLAGNTAQATPSHSFTITNNSSATLKFVQIKGMCVDSSTGATDIPPHATITVNWTDTNNVTYGCTNREKFIAVQYSRDDWNGWLGVVHRKISGDWYNGQFYAQTLQTSGPSYAFTDGPFPPSPIWALCSHDNSCFGPFSEMVDDNKTGYNWQRLYKTEGGWGFEYND